MFDVAGSAMHFPKSFPNPKAHIRGRCCFFTPRRTSSCSQALEVPSWALLVLSCVPPALAFSLILFCGVYSPLAAVLKTWHAFVSGM